jgi:hypothetical protein
MLKSCLPHLPDQVYDVQAEVRPIHKPALIWTAVVPMFIASVAVFAFCVKWVPCLRACRTDRVEVLTPDPPAYARARILSPHTRTTVTATTTTTSYYNTVMITVTSIEAGLQVGANCSMLGLQTSTNVGTFKSDSLTGITGNIGVWVRGEMG